MTIYYANIDTSASAGGNGSVNSPWNWDDLRTNMATFVDYDVVKIKGFYENDGIIFIPDDTISATGIKFEGWDPDVNGFWKIKSTIAEESVVLFRYNDIFTEIPLVSFKDLIVYHLSIGNISTTPAFMSSYFNNCIFYGFVNINNTDTIGENVYFNGNTFTNGELYIADKFASSIPNNIYFNDNVFYNYKLYLTPDGETGLDNITINNNIFSGASATVISYDPAYETLIVSGNTFNWVPSATFPDFSAVSVSNKINLKYESFGLPSKSFGRRSFYTISATSNIDVNYHHGAYYTPRVGPGAFYFTDYNVYVDLSAIGSSHSGTSASPYTWNELISFISDGNVVDEDVFKLRSSTSAGATLYGPINYNFEVNIQFDAWNLSAYGPWEIDFDYQSIGENSYYSYYPATTITNINMSNGILRDVGYYSITNTKFENMYIKCNDEDSCGPHSIIFKVPNFDNPQQIWSFSAFGCTFNTFGSFIEIYSNLNYLSQPRAKLNVNFKDSVFITSAETTLLSNTTFAISAMSATFDYCIFPFVSENIFLDFNTYGNDTLTSAFNNCQLNWIQGKIPENFPLEYNEPQSNYKWSILSVGMNAIIASGSNEW